MWRGLNYLTVFIVTIVIARLFKAGESGVINYLINNLALLILFTGMSLESATGYYSAKNEISQPVLAGISITVAAAGMIVSAIIVKLLFEVHDNNLMLAAVAYCGGIVLVNYFTVLFYSHHNYMVPNCIIVVINVIIIAICILSGDSLVENQGVSFLKFYFLSFFLTGLIMTAVYVRRYVRKIRFPSFSATNKIFRYASVAMITNLIFFLVYRVDYWFVHRNCTEEAMGNYIQVSKLAQIFMLLPAIVASVIFTRTAKASAHDHLRELQLLSRLLLSMYLVLLFLLGVTGYWLFPAIYGQSFMLMYLPFLILIPGILSLSTLTLVAAFNAGQGRIGVNLRGGLLALFVILTGNAIFSERYGIYAAAAVSSIGYLTYQVYVMHQLKRNNKNIRLEDFFKPRLIDLSFVKNLLTKEKI